MIRERVVKVLLVLVGLALIAGIYPLATSLTHTMNSQVSLGDQMILGIYFPIGIFLLLAARNPSENRSLILAFAWSTLAHMGVMFVQAVQAHSLREDAPVPMVICAICVALLLLTPARQPPPRALEARA